MISVLKAGLYTSIQDVGRYNYLEFGVPVSGIMDRRAAQLANALVGNTKEAAVLEITMLGPELHFSKPAYIAITGAYFNPKLNNKVISQNKIVFIEANSILSFKQSTLGFRGYMAIQGGLQSAKVLSSRSMYKGITSTYKLTKGDEINFKDAIDFNRQPQYAQLAISDSYIASQTLDVFEGPELYQLSKNQKAFIFETVFTISKNNNRMGYQLDEPVKNDLGSIITSPVMPGTVQLTPSGHLIVLMRDSQTTGGYPRVMQLSEHAINTLSQKQTGNKIRFRLLNF